MNRSPDNTVCRFCGKGLEPATDSFYRHPHVSVALAALIAFRVYSSAGEHFVDIEGVTGSIPVIPTIPRPRGDGDQDKPGVSSRR